jgi:UDP-glucose 4-epimerase
MKNVLICGKSSYVGGKLIEALSDQFNFTELDMRTSEWKEFDFTPFESIVYLAAIVHRPDVHDGQLYREVNEKLPVNVAEKAAKQGVAQFIFFSTMGVYGLAPSLPGNGRISVNTPYHPVNLYGKSKLNAEIRLAILQKEQDFKLCIVRPPNVYGENCPGNYYQYIKFCAKYLPIFPLMNRNKFSMISIENLCSKLEEIIQNNIEGIICPQDPLLISNSE